MTGYFIPRIFYPGGRPSRSRSPSPNPSSRKYYPYYRVFQFYVRNEYTRSVINIIRAVQLRAWLGQNISGGMHASRPHRGRTMHAISCKQQCAPFYSFLDPPLVVRRYIDFLIILLIPTPLALALFLQQHLYFFVHF